jgi:hypothetical protein
MTPRFLLSVVALATLSSLAACGGGAASGDGVQAQQVGGIGGSGLTTQGVGGIGGSGVNAQGIGGIGGSGISSQSIGGIGGSGVTAQGGLPLDAAITVADGQVAASTQDLDVCNAVTTSAGSYALGAVARGATQVASAF